MSRQWEIGGITISAIKLAMIIMASGLLCVMGMATAMAASPDQVIGDSWKAEYTGTGSSTSPWQLADGDTELHVMSSAAYGSAPKQRVPGSGYGDSEQYGGIQSSTSDQQMPGSGYDDSHSGSGYGDSHPGSGYGDSHPYGGAQSQVPGYGASDEYGGYGDGYGGSYGGSYDGVQSSTSEQQVAGSMWGKKNHDWLSPGGVATVHYYDWYYPKKSHYSSWYPTTYYTTRYYPKTYYYSWYEPVVYSSWDPWWATNVYGTYTTTYYWSSSWGW